MTPSRWQQIEELYHAALEREPGERAALLERADPELRREVESLLAQDSSKIGALDRPAWVGADGVSALDSTVALIASGTQLGPYKIEGPLAAGGMGEVFRGVDIRLGRPVAVKTSREQFSARFDREARAISSLNHPHICTLYDVGPNYLVMELCEGETLAARLKRGKLSIQETLRYGAQIADAVAAAHAKGITHRDLKPGNIMLGKSGIKVLDFGLAKSPQDLTLTGTRMVMGTPAYMAPEQRERKECDARTDIYSLGLVLYEMATGKQADQGQTPLLNQLPEKLAHVIERCLAQDPGDRWQSARDVQRELQWAAISTPLREGASEPGVALRLWLALGLAVLATLALIALAFFHFREAPPPEPRNVRFQIPPPEKSSIEYFKLSPDGRLLAFTAGQRLWIRSLDTLQALALPGTEGAYRMFWSPDSQFIAFFAQGKLKKIAASGGPAQILCNAPEPFGGTWNRDGVIVFPLSLTSGLFQVSAGGGDPVPLTPTSASTPVVQARFPEFLPDGRHFLYSGADLSGDKPEGRSIYYGSLDGTPPIRLLPNLIGNATYVQAAGTPGQSGAVQNGYLVFRRGEALMAQRFNPTRASLIGAASPVGEKVGGDVLWTAFSVSENGTLVYASAADATVQLSWKDRTGKQVGLFGPPGTYGDFRLAPDEKRIAFSNSPGNSGNRDVWVLDSVRGVTSRLTFDPAIDDPPMWSPDGLRVVWASNRSGLFDLYAKSANGAAPEQLLVKMGAPTGWPEDWSRDGRFIIYQIPGTKTGQDIWIAPQASDDAEHKPFPYLQSQFDEKHARFSPDGRWVAYTSNESGLEEVYVQSFTGSGLRFQISTGGGREPQWRKDGTEVFYISEDRTLVAVTVKFATSASEPLQLGQPKPLFPLTLLDTFFVGRSYEVSNDGQRFLVPAIASGATAPPLTVVLNWQTALQK